MKVKSFTFTSTMQCEPRLASLHNRVQEGKTAKKGIQLYTITVKQQLSIVNIFREHVHS